MKRFHRCRWFWLTVSLLVFVSLLGPSDRALSAFPGANGQIAFVSTEPTNTTQLFLVVPGGDPQQLTFGTTFVGGAGARWDPAWSPAGTALAYGHWLWGSLTSADIYVRENGEERRLTNDPGWETDPAWSPDGKRIAFANLGGASPSIWVVPASGGTPSLLRQPGLAPAWSPDGSKIAFVDPSSGRTLIDVMNADGSDARQLTPSPGPWGGSGPDLAPDWSPDGSRLVFLSRRSGTWEVWSISAGGGSPRQLTTGGRSGAAEYDPGFDPVWSPDGTRIAYGHDTNGTFVLSVMNADGTEQTTVASLTKVGSNWVAMPTWQPATDLVVRSAGATSVQREKRLTLRASVRNISPLAARPVAVTIAARGAKSSVERVRISRGTCMLRPSARCRVGELAGGGTVRLSVTLTARVHGTLTVRFSASTSTADATPATNSTTVTVRVR